MKLEQVVFVVGNEKWRINCYRLTAESGESCFLWNEHLYSSLLPIEERQLRRSRQSAETYQRDCPGKRYALKAVSFWEHIVENIEAKENTILEEIEN